MDATATADAIGAPIWSATTNWIASAGGSLADAISFDTSSEIEDDQEEAKPLLLLRPEGDDPPPCEITICFREKHEIHRVYVRSTARVYEIYYSSDHQDGNEEYLCTVRCGAATKQTLECITGTINGCHNNGTAARPDLGVRCNSNNSDEEGWVQIRAPDSPVADNKEYSMPENDIGMDHPEMQIHYEATAEISDYSPCMSLTLRLLSIQTKACVHIEEIYVYADPVELSSSDQSVCMDDNSGRSSLLGMLIPGLMQLSKPGANRDNWFAKEASGSKYQQSTEKTAQTHTSDVENIKTQESCSWNSPGQKWGTNQDEQTDLKPIKLQYESIQEVTAPYLRSGSLTDTDNNQVYNRLERKLDELVLKVGRVEAFCSKFEENMLKPLCCMEQRLQQLEQKLDVLAVKGQPCEQPLPSSTSNSESNEYDLRNEDDNTNLEEPKEDTRSVGTTPEDGVEPNFESPTRPGLAIKAPEFLSEDDECSNSEDTLHPLTEDLPKSKRPLSIDSALASSLAAFLTSTTTVTSPNPRPNLMEISQESVNDNSSLEALVGISSEGVHNSSNNPVIEDNHDKFLDAAAMEGPCCGESSLLAPDANGDQELSSEMNKSLGRTDMVTEDTFSNDLLLAANLDVLPPALSTKAKSGFIILPQDFPYRYSSFCSDDNLESPELDCLEDQASIPTIRHTVPPLAAFLLSRTVQSSRSLTNQVSAPSEPSDIGRSELPASIILVCEGEDTSGVQQQEETEMKNEIYPDPRLSLSSLEASFEQENHEGIEEDDQHAENSDYYTIIGLGAGIRQKCHGGSGADNNDADKVAIHGFDSLSRGWIGNESSTSSSFSKNFAKERVETEWSVGGTSDSSGETFMIQDHCNWLSDSSNYETGPAAVEAPYPAGDTTFTCNSSLGCATESSNKDLEDTLCDVKFNSEENWISGLPLEFLLDSTPDANKPVASTSGGGGEGYATDSNSDSEGSYLDSPKHGR